MLKLNQPQYSELNRLIAQVTCGITASIRFPGMLNGDLRKLGTHNLLHICLIEWFM